MNTRRKVNMSKEGCKCFFGKILFRILIIETGAADFLKKYTSNFGLIFIHVI